MSRERRLEMIDRKHPKLSLLRQCNLLDISRSSVYYHGREADEYDLEFMSLIDHQYLKTPFYGSRRMTAHLRRQGHQVNRKRVQRLMRVRDHSYLPASQHKQAIAGAQDILIPVAGIDDQPGQSGVGCRHHLHSHGSRLHVPGRHHGLVQSVCAGVAVVQHHGCGVLR